LVKLGKLLHMEVFEREQKEIQIGSIAIDVAKKGDVLEIREVKRSERLETAHRYQTLYYLYYLKKLGIPAKAVLSYPKAKKNVELKLSDEIEKEMERILEEIDEICRGEMPKPEYKGQCRRCAYFEFCFS